MFVCYWFGFFFSLLLMLCFKIYILLFPLPLLCALTLGFWFVRAQCRKWPYSVASGKKRVRFTVDTAPPSDGDSDTTEHTIVDGWSTNNRKRDGGYERAASDNDDTLSGLGKSRFCNKRRAIGSAVSF